MRLATLGPALTFSDKATHKFCATHDLQCLISYHKTIPAVFEAVSTGLADAGVIPIENMSEGFVQPSLDALLASNLSIIEELTLSVQFGFVGNRKDLNEIEKVFVQPVAMGQCSQFIATLNEPAIINTNSNIESLELLLTEDTSPAGAIVPAHTIKESIELPSVISNVSNYEHNKTRFIVVSSTPLEKIVSQDIKTSLLIRDDSDHSGILSHIATAFASRDINITSIISRPTKEAIGKYHFFIDIEGSSYSPIVREAIKEIDSKFSTRLLGTYQEVKE